MVTFRVFFGGLGLALPCKLMLIIVIGSIGGGCFEKLSN
jgi:hypothetical protein